MEEPKYRIRFIETEIPVKGVKVIWEVEVSESLGTITRIEALRNSEVTSLLDEPTNFYGQFRLGTRITPRVELIGSKIIEGATLHDLLGVRVATDDREFRWSTNEPKPPFLHASPSGVFSRFDESVEISLSKLIPAHRDGQITWRVSNE